MSPLKSLLPLHINIGKGEGFFLASSLINGLSLIIFYHDCSQFLQWYDKSIIFFTCYIIAPINGHWNRWGSWGECSVTCGKGVHTRTRLCTDPAPKNGGDNCLGDNTEQQECAKISCSAGKINYLRLDEIYFDISQEHFLQRYLWPLQSVEHQ